MKNSFAFFLFLVLISSYDLIGQKNNLTLDDIFNKNVFRAKTIDGFSSLKNGTQYLKLNEDSLNKTLDLNVYDFKTGKFVKNFAKGINVVLDGKTISLKNYKLSEDETKLLIWNGTEMIYRHSSRSNYFVYDIKANKLIDLSIFGKVQLCELSPDGNRVAYVRDNNLYVRELNSMYEKMVTQDGKKNFIINGAPDWVYEEEFSFSKGFEWSPDGTKLAFMKFDESKVKEYTLTYYDSLYPREEKYKYPKAGETNSIVNVFIYNNVAGGIIKADVGTNTDQYIPRINWTYDNTLCIMRLNRLQNKVDLLLCDTVTGKTKTLLTEEDKTYIDIANSYKLTFIKDKKHFIWMSYRDGFNQLYFYKMDGTLEKQITTDKKDVLSFYGYDEKTKTFFYQSYESSPANKQVYSITLDGKKKLLTYADGSNNASFSSGLKYFVNNYSTLNSPPLYELYSSDGKKIKVLEDNKVLSEKINQSNLSKIELLTITTEQNVTLQAWMIKPVEFDSSKKYPVLMYVYGGPASPLVNNSFPTSRGMWFQMLSQKGYIIACVDNRGTTKQGYDFLRCIYKQLGKLETDDQINAAKWLGKQSYVDASRIGIFGWSYGGYMAALCMTKGADVFKAGISVAPVTNWRYYDNIYTERYLRTPQENPTGYDENAPINFAGKMKGKYLLIHGMADDNVHYQNAIMFSDQLIKAGVQFEEMSYPNKAHGISGSGATMHIYKKMTDFILEKL